MALSLTQIKSANSAVSLRGFNALVVGGTSGIGQGIAVRLAQANAAVTIVGRDEVRGAAVVQEMLARSTAGDDGQKPAFSFVRCDASSLKDIKVCADTFSRNNSKLDLLVLTQGIATMDGYTPTVEGIDRKLAVHYYGRVAFMKCFSPFMKQTSKVPQVLSVLSAGVHSAYSGYKIDTHLRTNYSIKNAADAAGFYNDIAVDKMSQEFPGVRYIHSAPGIVNTNWGSEFPFYLRYPVRGVLGLFGSSIHDVGDIQCYALLQYAATGNPEGGSLLISPSGSTAQRTSLHEEAADSVWEQTNELLRTVGDIN